MAKVGMLASLAVHEDTLDESFQESLRGGGLPAMTLDEGLVVQARNHLDVRGIGPQAIQEQGQIQLRMELGSIKIVFLDH